MSEKQQRLVLSIIDFLNQSIADGTVKSEDSESLEVAIQCIGEAFGVDPTNSEQTEKLSIKPATLPTIFDVFLKTRSKSSQGGSDASTSAASASTPENPSASDKAEAEKHKAQGNVFMSKKSYDEAIEAYTKAINLDATNPVFFSNRAAAYSLKSDHLSAIGDAEKAISVDPTYVKAYHRLGHAYYSMFDYEEAVKAFEKGLEHDPNNAGLKAGVADAKTRIKSKSTTTSPPSTGARSGGAGSGAEGGGMADILAGMRDAGGMPDFNSFLNNPQMMQMAQQLAANGGLEQLMQNPAVANMMSRIQGGDMPTMDEIMRDPALRSLAGQFGANMGRQ
ncbi:hypothetical protein AX16_005567 [Volvariella volvacea WC 439]|nr:hypothetical protein AX16_005567 [Volvariella volvacea WC 439]